MAEMNAPPENAPVSGPDPDEEARLIREAEANARAALMEEYGQWRNRIERTKKERRELIRTWSENVHFRRGKPFPTDSDTDRVYVNLDWSKTKSKQSSLFSEVPQVRLNPKHAMFQDAVPIFGRLLNEELSRANVGTAVDEALLDCINAAGVGAVIVRYERRTETVQVPAVDPQTLPPEIQMAFMRQPELMPMVDSERTSSYRYVIERFSPGDLLWPVEFTGSDFDQAPWIGRSGFRHWADAALEFGLTEADKPRVLTSGPRRADDTIREDSATTESPDDDLVEFDEIYYWAAMFDPAEPQLRRIRRLVFVKGMPEPVIDEPWAGQQLSETPGQQALLGSLKFPIRLLTLTYISDDAIPPSDSAVARPQVLELIKGRSQMILQRDRSLPLRWFDVNGLDPMVQAQMLRGTWQGIVPTNGPGGDVMGEIARASYPSEDFTFDGVAKGDADEIWQIGINQQGQFASGRRSASEANIVQGNFEVRLSYERGRVALFLSGIAEVLAGLIALYHPFDSLTPEEQQALKQSWDQQTINGWFVYEVTPDSTQRLSADQKIERLMSVMNMLAPTGYLNVEPIIRQIVTLAGLDPQALVKTPEPPKPEANLSYRMSGEDMLNPVVLAMAMEAGHMPSREAIESAKQILLEAAQPPMVPQPGAPGPAQAPPGGQIGPPPGPRINPVGEDPLLETMQRLNRRSDDSIA